MTTPPDKPRIQDVQPNRDRLRTLREELMREMEATTYGEVRSKFLETLNANRAPDAARGNPGTSVQRERGAGIWNKAFANTGMMQRSSIVLLAEFFDVEPDELIQPPPPQTPSNTADQTRATEDQTMPDFPIEPVLKSLFAYWKQSDGQDMQMRDLCDQLTEQLDRHITISVFIHQGQLPDPDRIREVLREASRIDPGVRNLGVRISKLYEQSVGNPSRINRPTARGARSQAFTAEGGIHISHGTLMGDVFNFGPSRKEEDEESGS